MQRATVRPSNQRKITMHPAPALKELVSWFKRQITFFALVAAPSIVAAGTADIFVPGYLKYEYFPAANRLTVENGTAGSPSFAGNTIGSDKSGFATIFETGVSFADNYANRFSGFFVPQATGPYVFYVSGIFDSDLFLSTDDDPANKRLVAQVPTWTNNRVWKSIPQQHSDTWTNATGNTPYAAGIDLTAGTPYYIEGVHNGGGGPDSFGATFKLLSDPDPADGDAPKFKGNAIAVRIPPPTITISLSGATLMVSWDTAGGHLESSPVLSATSWSNLGYANPAQITISSSSNVFLRVVTP
jgi:hypothetical protein